MEEFPHLVQMHGKYAKDGFAAISLNVDDLEEKGVKDKVLAFLNKEGATFTNLILNEDASVLADKLGVEGLPSVFLFGRDGKIVKHFKDGEKYSEIEKHVAAELKK
jgi:hypothetical protein